MNLKKNTMVNVQAPEQATYHQGPILTNGALEFVYNKPVAYPLQTLWGRGVQILRQLNVVQPEQMRVNPVVTVAPIYGAGQPATQLQFQRLFEAVPSNG